MTLYLQSEDDDNKFEVMCKVVVFIGLQLLGSIRNHLTMLHKNTTQTNTRSITVDLKASSIIGEDQYSGDHESTLQLEKTLFTFGVPIKESSLLSETSQRNGNTRESFLKHR